MATLIQNSLLFGLVQVVKFGEVSIQVPCGDSLNRNNCVLKNKYYFHQFPLIIEA